MTSSSNPEDPEYIQNFKASRIDRIGIISSGQNFITYPKELIMVSNTIAERFRFGPANQNEIIPIKEDNGTIRVFYASNYARTIEKNRLGSKFLLRKWLELYVKEYTDEKGEKHHGLGFPPKYVVLNGKDVIAKQELDKIFFEKYKTAVNLINSTNTVKIKDPTKTRPIQGSEYDVIQQAKEMLAQPDQINVEQKTATLNEAEQLLDQFKSETRAIYLNIPKPVEDLFNNVAINPDGIRDIIDLANISDALDIQLLKEQTLGFIKLKTKAMTGEELRRAGWLLPHNQDPHPEGHISNWPH